MCGAVIPLSRASEQWRNMISEAKPGSSLLKAHEHLLFMTAVHDNLFANAKVAQLLLDPVMKSIHQLEADQPMLSYLNCVVFNLLTHFGEFSLTHEDSYTVGSVPSRKNSRQVAKPITLVESLEKDIAFMWRPAMSAAAVLDPSNGS